MKRFQAILKSESALAEVASKKLVDNPSCGLDEGRFQKSIPLDVTTFSETKAATSGVRSEGLMRHVCYPYFEQKMKKLYGWEAARSREEWAKLAADKRVERDYKGPKGTELRLVVKLHDQAIGYNDVSQTKAVTHASKPSKKRMSEEELQSMEQDMMRGHQSFSDELYQPVHGNLFENWENGFTAPILPEAECCSCTLSQVLLLRLRNKAHCVSVHRLPKLLAENLSSLSVKDG